MRRRAIGGTGVWMSAVGFGGSAIAGLYTAVDDDTAVAAVEAAWDAGVRYFDTAPHYGLGLSERRLGSALARYRREEYVLSTKVGRLLEPNPHPTGADPAGFAVGDDLRRRLDYSADGVRRSIDDSLERLGTDYVDIALVHDPDDHMDTALGEAVPALAELRSQGVVRAVGAGGNSPAPLLRFAAMDAVGVLMVAGRWTALDRSAGPLLEDCARRGVAVLAAAPFNSGLLARNRPLDDAPFDYVRAPADVLARARRIADLCRAHGVPLPAVAMQFPLRHRAVAAVVAGMRNAEESRADTAWATARIPDDLWPALDEIVATPEVAQGGG